jgi:hypothetical protein
MNLEEFQRTVFDLIRQPLTADERMSPQTPDGRSTREVVETVVKPNDRLSSVERLEIYNRVYWFRILSSLAEDFPGLCAIIRQHRFDKLLVAFLTECPSESFSLRNLGSRLEDWLRQHPEFAPGRERIALDMVRLEWADIDVFDSAEFPAMTQEDLLQLGEDPVFHLQPYLRLLELEYPVDDLLLRIREDEDPENDIASNVVVEISHHRRRKKISLPKPRKIFLAVHRQENMNYFKRLEPEAFALLQAIQQGKSLSEAIEVSVSLTNKDVSEITGQLHGWFANWSSLGWFCKPQESATSAISS